MLLWPRADHRGLTGFPKWRRPVTAAALLLGFSIPVTLAAKRESLELRHVQLEFPGAPAAILPVDLDRDGLLDLFVVLAYTEVESIGVDRIENMVQISTVIPALFDRREARLFLAQPDGGYRAAGAALPLPKSVLAISPGTDAIPLIALTDDGVSEIRFRPEDPGLLELIPLISDPPVIAGAGSLFSKLDWVHDFDGDGRKDLLLPARDGPAIYLSGVDGFAATPIQRLTLPTDSSGSSGEGQWRVYPMPRVEDVNDDGHVDLIIPRSRTMAHLLVGAGDGTFAPALAGLADCPAGEATLPVVAADGSTGKFEGRLVYFGNLDGVGRAELMTREEIEPSKHGMRASLKHTKRPPQRFRFHRLRDDLSIEAEPYYEFQALGHPFDEVDFGAANMGLLQDLDGDGRKDLVTVTLDFSIFQLIKIMATRRITIGMDFHVWAQQEDGSFREVQGLDLSEKLRFNLNDLKLSRLAQFAGDFDGDGRIDFVHFGRGKQLTIHRGQPGCRYPARPDLVIELEEELPDLGLVRVEDLNGDGKADLSIVRPQPLDSRDVSPPVLMDLYLSGDSR